MTTEQETGRGAPARRAVPKTGTRRSATPHQSKPRPRTDTRPEADAKLSAAERARADAKPSAAERARADRADLAADRRPAGVRAETSGTASSAAAGKVSGVASGAAPGKAPGKTSGKAPVVERPAAPGKRPVRGRTRPESGSPSARPAPRRRPARGRQRAPFVLLVVGLLCGGLVSLLLLNTMLAQDAITDATLRKEIEVAREQNAKIDQEYQRKTQPDVIAELAEKQGEKPNWDNVDIWSSAGDQASQVDRER
ncbi:hypothetical protein [Nonomuraea sp. NPDC050643]|uniref:hypothetical protein n=1 Tax=Nonomuraea sp. NPDC050643 TaxID=3155660 RepID=UPI0033CFA60F